MTDNNVKPDIQAALKALQDGFGKKLPERIGEINTIWASVQADRENAELLNHLHLKLHSLTGTAGTYHFDEISTIARDGEQITKAMAAAGGFSSQQQDDLNAALLHLNECTHIPTQQSGSETIIPAQQATATSEDKKRIFLVEDDQETRQSTAMQIGVFGYEVETFSDLESFVSAFRSSEPDITIMDIMFEGCEKTGIDIMEELNRERKRPAKTIFITSDMDIKHRLAAVRAGGVAYFQKPANIGQLIDTLDLLTQRESPEPYRVLVIDDNEEQAKFSELVLQQAGMQTQSVTQPLHALETLNDFLPDLILMDIYMPECNGLELSRVIRQMDTHVSIPIVFLSAESDLRKQLDAMSLGGDDFLTKPIVPWHLVSSVTSRIKRGRTIRMLAECDSLTGLLNHTSGKKRFDAEIARAKRDGSPVSFAMLDIDHFKHVNDTYGHPTGDRVLKSLSGLLRQRLRISDSISRYGGEEFVAILPDTSSENAKKIMDAIREDFSAIKQQCEDGREFQCAFSCGISALGVVESATALINAADKALYEAKESGRNRIVIATTESTK